MPDREKIIKELKDYRDREFIKEGITVFDNDPRYRKMLINDVLALLKEQEAVVRCKDCENWIPGYITDQDDFIPPKCGKYQQMVGHSANDFCSLAEKQEGR